MSDRDEEERAGSEGGEPEPGRAPRVARSRIQRTPARERQPQDSLRKRSLRIGVVVLASVAFGLALWQSLLPDPVEPPEVVFSGGEFALLQPVGRSARFDLFRWEHAVGAGIEFEVEVIELGPEGRRLHSIKSGRLRVPEWRPAPELFQSWTNITWEVSVWRDSLEAVEYAWADASLLP